ncbi:MAG TPA: hypothetical protein VKT20_05740 [Candidatus Dormibacteraeota bacterium]|nr:hypothetical protein [Candidatus Dormibacteraeota bacterium]
MARKKTTTATATPLGPDELRLINAYWHAANYISVGQTVLNQCFPRV